MITQITLLILLLASPLFAMAPLTTTPQTLTQEQSAKIETTHDEQKGRTSLKTVPVKIGGAGKYHSIQISASFSFPGRTPVTPAIVDFELQTVVKGRLRTDLYVVFLIDGETVFLSSSRWAVKRPIPGRVWLGERLVFRMPYETFVKVTKAKTLAIKFDGVSFPVGEKEQQVLRELLTYMKPPAKS